jgi:hypothetical protein
VPDEIAEGDEAADSAENHVNPCRKRQLNAGNGDLGDRNRENRLIAKIVVQDDPKHRGDSKL